MTGTVTLAQLPVETTAPAGGVVHAYDPSQPVGLRDVALTIPALASNAPVQSVATRTGNVVLSNTDISGLGALATLNTAPIANGGTGATTAPAALTALGAAATASPLSQFAATTSAQLAGVLSDETGTGVAVFGTAPTISQPNIVGVTSASNAAAGSIGEYISSQVLQGSATGITTGTPANVTSISLSPGDWDVWGSVGFVAAGSTTATQQIGWISTTSASLPASPNNGAMFSYLGTGAAAGGNGVFPIGRIRLSLASTTTVYLGAQSSFSVSTMSVYGFIGARRVR
jgi:hypothetical protein